MDLESLFGTQQFKELQKLSEEDKEEVIKERRQQVANSMLREAQATARNARLVHFAEIAQRNPFAFSARERVNFDLAGALEKRGVLTFTDDFDSDTKELLKAYINQIAQDSGLVVFNKQTLEALQRQVYKSFFNSDNLFVNALLQHTQGNLRGQRLEDVEVSGDSEEEGSSRKALIDLVSPVLEEWDFSKLDSDDFYDDKIKAQIAYYKTAYAKEQDTTGITNPEQIVKVQKQKLEEIAYDRQNPITILGVSDFPAGISHADLDELNKLAEEIFKNWRFCVRVSNC